MCRQPRFRAVSSSAQYFNGVNGNCNFFELILNGLLPKCALIPRRILAAFVPNNIIKLEL